MALTLPNPFTACRSFCEINHKFQGVVDNARKPVDNPAILRASLTMSSRHAAIYFLVAENLISALP
jgi:hypothetical protein